MQKLIAAMEIAGTNMAFNQDFRSRNFWLLRSLKNSSTVGEKEVCRKEKLLRNTFNIDLILFLHVTTSSFLGKLKTLQATEVQLAEHLFAKEKEVGSSPTC